MRKAAYNAAGDGGVLLIAPNKCLISHDPAFQERFDRSFKNDSIWGGAL
jgi:hypothetical protein